MEETPGTLRCDICGRLTDRLATATQSVRSLSLGREVRTGDLVCERCQKQLREEFTEEEMLRGPA